MLVSYAHPDVYLIVLVGLGCVCSHCVQVGGRQWRHSLQRPAAREGAEDRVQAPQTYTAPELAATPRNTAGPQTAAPTYRAVRCSTPDRRSVFLNTDIGDSGRAS